MSVDLDNVCSERMGRSSHGTSCDRSDTNDALEWSKYLGIIDDICEAIDRVTIYR